MAKFNVTTIRPKGFLHSSAFAELKESLCWSLAELGHEVMATENAFAASQATNIIFGAELLGPTSTLPQDSILYNCEQPSHPSMENVRRLSQGNQVWDIYKSNVEDWHRRGIHAIHVPPGYTPNLTRVPKAETQDIDIAFFGWMTDRRRKILADLRSAGLRVYSSDSCYGGARDQILSRTKVCLNIHHDGRDLFEAVRVSYLLANGKCVVTENSRDDADYTYWHGDIATLENIVYLCQELCKHEKVRMKFESIDSQGFTKQNFTETIHRALSGPEKSSPLKPTHPIHVRYLQGCQEGDMKDFLPLLRGLAKGQVLEIGVRDGASTSALLLGLEERGGQLTSLDIQDCSSLWQHPQWKFMQLDSKTFHGLGSYYSLIFIDGDHSPEGFMKDLENAMQWVKPGGLILCHDISPLPNCTQEASGGDWPSQYVGEYFFEYARKHKLRHFIFPGTWGMGVIVKDWL